MRAIGANPGFTQIDFTKNILFLDISDPMIAEKQIAKPQKEDPIIKIEPTNIRLVATSDTRFGNQGISGTLNPPQMREPVYRRLLTALEHLPDYVGIAVFEGYRPLNVQRQYFQNKLAELSSKSSVSDEVSKDSLISSASKWVANPDGKLVPPHSTGAAVDVRLYQINQKDSSFEFLNSGSFGTIFGSNPHPETFSNTELSENQIENRMLLLTAMTKAGFVNYSKEYWHYSWGDQTAAHVLGESKAQYGAVSPGSEP